MTIIIAEVGHNHNGNMEMAYELIQRAKASGADIVKFQLYETSKIVPRNSEWYWDLERGEITKNQWLFLAEKAKEIGIELLASVFDCERVEWCEEVDVKCYKIASRSIYDGELLDKVVETGKDMIISLGMVDERGIPHVSAPGIGVYYLYCVAKYPAPLTEIHLSAVDFRKYAGFSDHTIGLEASIMAMARGARIIEKHLTLDKSLDGCDHAGSMIPSELKDLVRYARLFEEMS